MTNKIETQIDTVIVTPTLGDRPSLARTVETIASIGGDRVTHVLVCPQSCADKLQLQFPKCQVLCEPKKTGVYGAVNYGLRNSIGGCQYLSYINDDDYWLPSYKNLFSILDRSPNIDLAYGRVNYVDEKDKLIFESTSSGNYKSFKSLIGRDVVLFTQQAVLMRSNVFEALNGFDESYRLVADTEFWIRAVESTFKMAFHDATCAAYMIQSGQLSGDLQLSSKETQRIKETHKITDDWRALASLIRFRIRNVPTYFRLWAKYGTFRSASVHASARDNTLKA